MTGKEFKQVVSQIPDDVEICEIHPELGNTQLIDKLYIHYMDCTMQYIHDDLTYKRFAVLSTRVKR